MRTRVATGCGSVVQSDERTGILRYNAASKASPTTAPNDNRQLCEDEPTESLVPVVPWKVKDLQGDIKEFTYEASLGETADPNGFIRWSLLNQALFLNYSDPSIVHVEEDNFQFPSDYCIVPCKFFH